MKTPAAFLPPPTPYKKKFSLSSTTVPKVDTCGQLAEGSFYKIYLTTRDTILRVSKKRMQNAEEVKILKQLDHPFINKMFRWWVDDGHLNFEMALCDFNLKNRENKIEKFLDKNFKEGEIKKKNKIKLKATLEDKKVSSYADTSGKKGVMHINASTPPVLNTSSPSNLQRKKLKNQPHIIHTSDNITTVANTDNDTKEMQKDLFIKRCHTTQTIKTEEKLKEAVKLIVKEKRKAAIDGENFIKKIFGKRVRATNKVQDTNNLIEQYPNLTSSRSKLPNFKASTKTGQALLQDKKVQWNENEDTTYALVESSNKPIVNGIFDPFSESFVKCSTSIVISDDSSGSCTQELPMLENIDVPNWIAVMMYQISKALAYVHSKDIVHMDVKPENILVKLDNEELTFFLCDFNISKFGEGSFDLDGDKTYMAPEVLRNRCYYKSDVFSLGLVFLQLVNNKILPNKGTEYKQLRRKDFTGWKVDYILSRMLEKDPTERCTAQEVSDYFSSLIFT